MRATILPYALVLTKAHRATVSVMAKGCMTTEGFLIFTTQFYACVGNYNARVFIS